MSNNTTSTTSTTSAVSRRMEPAERRKHILRLCGADFNPRSTDSYYAGLANALVTARLVSPDKAALAAAVLRSINAGNQSAVAQLMGGGEDDKPTKATADSLLATLGIKL